MKVFLVELVSDELEFLSNADLHASCWLLRLLLKPFHPPSLHLMLLLRPLISNLLKPRWKVQSKACVACRKKAIDTGQVNFISPAPHNTPKTVTLLTSVEAGGRS